MELANDAMIAQGNAMANNEKYLDSYTGRMQKLSTATETFWINLLDTDFVKGIITVLTKLMEAFASLADFSGLLTTVLAISFAAAIKGLASFIKNTGGVVLAFKEAKRQIREKTISLVADTIATEANAAVLYDDAGAELFDSIQTDKNTKSKLANALASKALRLGLIGVTAAVVAVTVAYIAYKNTLSSHRKEMNKSLDAYKETSEELKSVNSKLEEVTEKIKEYNKQKAISGSLSLADANDLKILQEESKELREQAAILKQKRIDEANETLNKTQKTANSVQTYIDWDTYDEKVAVGNYAGTSVQGTTLDLLEEYLSYNPDMIVNGKKISEMENFTKDIEEAADIMNELYDSYSTLEKEGEKLSATQLAEYKRIKALREQYMLYLYTLNHTEEAYLALSDANKKIAVKNNLVEAGISEQFAEQVSDKLTSSQLEVAYSIAPIVTVDESEAEAAFTEEMEKLTEWMSEEGLDSTAIKNIHSNLINGTLDSKFGNIDMDDRAIITWTDELKDKFKTALESWDYDPEVGTIDTVFGGSGQFDGFEIAFSPILQTENGPVLMSQDNVDNYIKSLIKYAKQDDGEVSIEELLKLDESGELGFTVGGNLVKGIIGGITDGVGNNSEDFSAPVIAKLMHFAGEFGAISLLPMAEESAEEYIKRWLKEAQEVLSKSILTVPTPTSVFETASGLNEGLDVLTTFYKDVKDGGTFDYSSLFDDKDGGLKSIFGSYTEEYENFVETVMNNPADISATQEAFNELASVYVRNSKALENVTEETKSATVAMLKQMGIANAEEVVTSAINNNLAQAKKVILDAKEANVDLANANYDTIESFILEGKYSDDLANRIRFLIIQEKMVNGSLDTSEGIKQLKALSEQAGVTSRSLVKLLEATVELENANAMIASGDRATRHSNWDRYYAELKNKVNDLKEIVYSDTNTNISNSQIYSLPDIDFTGGSSSDSGSSETKETLDWIERAIKKIERAISQAENKASDAWRTWSERNSALIDEFDLVEQKIGAQADAYETYMKAANMVDLAENYKQLVRDGAIAIETITDSDLKDAISQYQDFYDKAMDAKDAMEELRDQIAEIAKTKFDNIKSEFEGMISLIEHTSNMVDAFMSQTETRGYVLSQKYYESLIASTEENISKQQEELDKLSKSLKESLDAGYISMYSEQWYELQGEINGVEESLTEATNKLYEYNKAMRELDWEIFEMQEDYISRITEESDFLITLLSEQEKSLYNSEGKFGLSNNGTSVAGLHALNYDTYMAQADDYADKIREIDKLLEDDANNKDLIDKRNEYLKAQRDNIKSAEDEKKAIQDLIKSSYDALLEALQKLIDKRKEALDAQKDLYDYEKTISEKTDNISSLQKQLMAYAGDNSEETKATVQKLTTELAEAEKDLEETEYERWLKDQTEMLDNFYNEVEEWLNSRIDDIEGLLADIITNTNENADTIHSTIVSETDKVGYSITDKMEEIWTQQQDGVDAVVALYSDFGSYSVNAINAIDGVKGKIQEMISHSDQLASSLISSIRDAVTGIGEYIMRAGNAGSVNINGGGSGGSSGDDGNSGTNPNDGNTSTTTTTTTTGYTAYAKIKSTGQNIFTTRASTLEEAKASARHQAQSSGYDIVGEGPNYVLCEKGVSTRYKVLNSSGSIVKVFDSESEASSYVNSHNQSNPRDPWSFTKYHIGLDKGLVGSNEFKMEDFELLQKLGADEVPAVLQKGEAVMTQNQMHNIANAVRLADYDSGLYAMQQKFISATLGNNGIIDNMRSGVRNGILSSVNGICGTGGTVNNDITLNVALPNVTDVDGFINELQTNKRFEKVIQAMTIDTAMGRNSLRKLSF